MRIILNLLINAGALLLTSYLVPGFHVETLAAAVLAAIVLGVINTFIKPILLFLTFPLNLLTLGLFTFVINALVLVMVTYVVKDVQVDSFWPTAILAALVLSVISTALSMLLKDVAGSKKKRK